MEIDYAEFNNPRLAKIYDSFNALTDDETFWLKKIESLHVTNISDLGCGTGLLTCKLAGFGYNITGIDPASSMLEVAKNKLYADKVKWRKGSSEQLEKNSNDLVVMTSHVAQFFVKNYEWNKSLKDIYDSLKPGAYLLFDSKNPLLKPWKKWNKEESYRILQSSEGKVESWIELISIKGNKVQFKIHYLFIDTQEKMVSNMELVYRSKNQLIKDLEQNGFELQKTYGNWDGRNLDENSPEMIFLAKKKY
jgi:ubiquinone/menaquinone biosynthesis C-methylase UbiE